MRSKITNEQFDAEVVRVAEVADRARDLALQKIERIRRFVGGAAVREIARLRARDGADAPTTVTAASKMLVQGRTITRLREDLKSARLGSRVKRDTIAVGKIVTKGGRPAVGVHVLIATDTGKAVGEAIVEEAGLFVIDRARDEFDQLVEGARALVIVFQDAAGRVLHKTTAPVHKQGAVVLTVDLSSKIAPPAVPDGSPGLSVIRGLGESRIARLAGAGVHTVADLARLKPETLVSLLRVRATQAEDFIEQAHRLVAS